MSLSADLGNGTGYVYVTLDDGTTITTSLRNDSSAREKLRALAAAKQSATSSTATYDSVFSIFGSRFWLYANGAAVEGNLGAATEITADIVGRTLQNPNFTTSAIIAGGVITITRVANRFNTSVDTQGGAATDTLDTITLTGVVNGDEITLWGLDAAKVTTVSSGTGNIFLADANNFITSNPQRSITLRYYDAGGGIATGWYEVSRSAVLPTVANLRVNSVPEPVAGITSAVLATAATTTFTVGSSKGYQVLTGSPVLVNNIAYTQGGSPIDGDTFTIDYQATPTLGGFTVTLFGVTLTTTQAAQRLRVTTTYSSVAGAWQTTVLPVTNSLDFATTTQLATKEDDLGNPASDGMVLSSTAAGVRSWAANANYPTLYNTTANNATTDLVQETLKSFSLPANSMLTAGDSVTIQSTNFTAANANNKTITVSFGATNVFNVTGAWNNMVVTVTAKVNMITATTQSYWAEAHVADAATGATSATYGFRGTAAETLTGAITIATKATTATAIGDATNYILSVDLTKKQ